MFTSSVGLVILQTRVLYVLSKYQGLFINGQGQGISTSSEDKCKNSRFHKSQYVPIRSVLHCARLPDRGVLDLSLIVDWVLRFVVKWFSGNDCSSDLGGVSIAIALPGCGGLGHV